MFVVYMLHDRNHKKKQVSPYWLDMGAYEQRETAETVAAQYDKPTKIVERHTVGGGK